MEGGFAGTVLGENLDGMAAIDQVGDLAEDETFRQGRKYLDNVGDLHDPARRERIRFLSLKYFARIHGPHRGNHFRRRSCPLWFGVSRSGTRHKNGERSAAGSLPISLIQRDTRCRAQGIKRSPRPA